MNKQEVYAFLESRQIAFESVEHTAVYTVEEADSLHLPYPEAGAKNLFLKDDKKRNYYLVTMRDGLHVPLKELRKHLGSRPLSFASSADLKKYLDLIPGAVTPLGILNNTDRNVQVILDSWFQHRLISVHPNDNTATIYLNCDALVEILNEHGNPVRFLDLEDPVQEPENPSGTRI